MSKSAILLAVAMFIFASCEKNNGYTFEYKVNADEVYAYDAKVNTNMSMSAMGEDVDMGNGMNMEMSFSITDVKENTFITNMVIDAIKSETTMSMPGQGSQSMIMDSKTEATDINSGDMGVVLKAMTGIPMEMTLTNKGKLESFTGFEKLLDAMMTIFPEELSEEEKMQTRMMIGQQFNEKMMSGIANQSIAQYPDNPIAIGEDWEVNTEISISGINVSAVIKYTLKSVEDNIANLDIEGVISTAADGSYMEAMGMQMEMTIGGTQKGTAKIDLNNGWFTEINIDQDFTGSMSMMGMSIPMESKTKTVITKK